MSLSAASNLIQSLSSIEKILVLCQNVPATKHACGKTRKKFTVRIKVTHDTALNKYVVSNVNMKQTLFLISTFDFIVPYKIMLTVVLLNQFFHLVHEFAVSCSFFCTSIGSQIHLLEFIARFQLMSFS